MLFRSVIRRDWQRAPLALLGCMPAFVTLTAFGFTGQIRFHFPAMPFIAAAAGIALADWWQRRARPATGVAVNRPSGSDPRAA